MQPGQNPPMTRHETPEERADRNLVELLQELRVVQTGVQIVFAFLLGVAFTSRFPQLSDFQRGTYVVTLLLTVVSAAVLAPPVALHRGLFHRGVKPRIVALSTRFAQIGLVFLALLHAAHRPQGHRALAAPGPPPLDRGTGSRSSTINQPDTPRPATVTRSQEPARHRPWMGFSAPAPATVNSRYGQVRCCARLR